MAAEYILNEGNMNVVLGEQGIRTFDTRTDSTLDISSVPVVKQLSHLPVIIDPSHASGASDIVAPLALAGRAAGADGLMIEVHNGEGDLRVAPGSKTRLMGANGAGKTTLLRALAHLNDDRFSITLDGVDARSLNRCDTRDALTEEIHERRQAKCNVYGCTSGDECKQQNQYDDEDRHVASSPSAACSISRKICSLSCPARCKRRRAAIIVAASSAIATKP